MADALSSIDLDALVKQATSGPPSAGYVGDTIKRVRDLEGQKQAETAPILERMKTDYDAGRKEVEAKTPAPLDVTEWKQKRPEANPVQEFGSLGSVFGILASAFTHQPWQTSMNAAASAMNAVRANDIAGYQDAYAAWKSNTEIMLKRHDAQYKDFQAAMEKMKTNTAEGNAMLTAISAKYGDQITESYKEAGLQGELFKVWEARQKAAEGLLQVLPRIEEMNTTVTLTHDLQKAREDLQQTQKVGDPSQVEEAQQRVKDAEQNIHDYATVKYPAMASGGRTPQAVALQSFITEYQQTHDGANPPAAEIQRYLSGTRSSTVGAQQAEAITKAIGDEEAKLGRKLSGQEELGIIQKFKGSGMSGNERQKLQERVDQFDNSTDKIDDAIGVLDKHFGAAGLAGRALRGKEVVSNIFGGNETDRVQFRRNIDYLQALSHRLLTDANGRPLSADAAKLDDYIGGLSMGDTTANTMRSLEEIKKLYTKMRSDTLLQLNSEWKPREERGSGAAPAAGNNADKPWLRAPVVK